MRLSSSVVCLEKRAFELGRSMVIEFVDGISDVSDNCLTNFARFTPDLTGR